MKRIATFIALVLLVAPMVAGAVEVSVGGTVIEIPAPQGYAVVTPQMQGLGAYFRQFVPARNEELAVFLPPRDVALAATGKVPRLSRYFAVQVGRKVARRSIPDALFARLKAYLKAHNEQAIQQVRKQFPGLMRHLEASLATNSDVHVKLSIAHTVLLPVHYEADQALAYSMFVNYGIQRTRGAPASYVSVVTVTFVHVHDKVLYLYAFAGKDDLKWSRRVSKQWATAVVAANR